MPEDSKEGMDQKNNFKSYLANHEAKETYAVDDKLSSLIIEYMQQALALHEIICDDAGLPVDYRFICVNRKFEELTGLSKNTVIGRRILELLPGTEEYWIDIYGKVALTGEPVMFEHYAAEFDKWYSVSAFCPQKGQFATVFTDITDQKYLFAKTRDALTRLESLLEHSPSPVIIFDEEGKYVEASAAAVSIIGINREQLIGRSCSQMISPDSQEDFFQIIRMLKHEGGSLQKTFPIEIDGEKHFFESSLFPVGKSEKGYDLFGAILNDITDRKEMESLIFNEKELFRTTLLSVGDAVISTDINGRIVVMNSVAEKLTGWKLEEARGRPLDSVFRIIYDSDGTVCPNPAEKVIESGKAYEIDSHTILVSRNDENISIEDSAAPIRDRQGNLNGVVIVFRDFSEKKQRLQQIEYLSFHDHLTGLYNRRYMDDTLARMDTRRNLPLTIMVIDVNGLKLINDTFGHESGDRLLCAVADILRLSCRADDIIARMGGDEFHIVLPNTDGNQAEAVKQRIVKAASESDLFSVIVSLAIGYDTKISSEQKLHEIVTSADNLMYKDKLKFGKSMRSRTVEIVLHNINEKYEQEQAHTERVAQYCEFICKAMELGEKSVSELREAAILHDIGKISIEPEILTKPGRLTKAEFELVKRHPETGYQILKNVDEYTALAEMVLYHHERWDGTGYPEGLRGNEIPLASRILAVADAFEAMTSVRSYKEALTAAEAIEELRKNAGSQFDPAVVEAFIETFRQ
jgi:diguanylate cyclase (GGDEF)-like protein/PAS domain S-box-containing protein